MATTTKLAGWFGVFESGEDPYAVLIRDGKEVDRMERDLHEVAFTDHMGREHDPRAAITGELWRISRDESARTVDMETAEAVCQVIGIDSPEMAYIYRVEAV